MLNKLQNLKIIIKDPLKGLERVCFFTGVASIFFSLFMIFVFGSTYNLEGAHAQRLAIFVGLWAPTLIGIANYLKKN